MHIGCDAITDRALFSLNQSIYKLRHYIRLLVWDLSSYVSSQTNLVDSIWQVIYGINAFFFRVLITNSGRHPNALLVASN